MGEIKVGSKVVPRGGINEMYEVMALKEENTLADLKSIWPYRPERHIRSALTKDLEILTEEQVKEFEDKAKVEYEAIIGPIKERRGKELQKMLHRKNS